MLLMAVTGCAGSGGSTTLTVFAASSLVDAMNELGPAYQRSHAEVTIRFSFARPQELADRLAEHEPADVIAITDSTAMTGLRKYVSGTGGRVFAYTSLTIAVAPGNPLRIRGLADLSRPRIRVVLPARTAPGGGYARQSLAKAGVTVRPASEEIDVPSVLTRVRTGEADAGIVYVTDLKSAGRAASSVPIPAAQNVTAGYPAAVVEDSDHKDASAAFVSWLGSATAKRILADHGFGTP